MKKITITPHEWMQIKTFSSPEGEGGTLEALNALLDKKYNHNRVPTNKAMNTPRTDDGTLLESTDLLAVLSKIKGYIESTEVTIDGEWGLCRNFDEIHKAGEVTETYDLICEILSANSVINNRVPPIYSKIAGEPHPTQEMEDSLYHYHQNVGHSHRIPR
jgi:hypothetical protein